MKTKISFLAESINRTSFEINSLVKVQKKSNFWRWFWFVMFLVFCLGSVIGYGLYRYHERTRLKDVYELGVK